MGTYVILAAPASRMRSEWFPCTLMLCTKQKAMGRSGQNQCPKETNDDDVGIPENACRHVETRDSRTH